MEPKTKIKDLTPGDIGAQSEYLAIAWLIGQEYEVYRNVSPNGQVDLIAKKGSESIEIDVKTVMNKKQRTVKSKALHDGGLCFSWNSYLSEEQMERGVRPLFVYQGKVGWNRDYF